MEPAYYLFSTRASGWLTPAGTYTSDITEARTLGKSEALTLARKHKSDAGYQLLPVCADDMEAL